MGDLRPRYLPPQPASKPASLNNHLNFKHANRNASNRKGLRQERVFASSLIINFMKPNKYVQSHHQSTGLFLSYLLHPGRPGQSQKKGLEDQGGVKGLPGASWSPLAFPWVPLVLPGSLPNIEKYEKLQYTLNYRIELFPGNLIRLKNGAQARLMIYSTFAATQQARLMIYNALVASPKSRPQLV